MNILIAMIFSLITMVFFVYKSFFIGYALLIIFFLFCTTAKITGFSFKEIYNMSLKGGLKGLIVLKVFILIGAITASWLAAGTVPSIVYYGLKFMNPNFFILSAFILSIFVSLLIGTAFGTASTVGVALMVMAKTGGVDLGLTAGAIISGAYFGDRMSPMSSSANLVASLTNTDLFSNISGMYKTVFIPTIISIIIYFSWSLKNPLNIVNNNILNQIQSTFIINPLILLPAGIIIILCVLKFNVKTAMAVSISVASTIAVFYQHIDIGSLIKFLLFGFHLDNSDPLSSIIGGGGIISMAKAGFIIFVSCAIAGIIENANLLSSLELILVRCKNRISHYLMTLMVAILTSALGCNQSISIVMTESIMKKTGERLGVSSQSRAIDIENTSIVVAALIPWNIAALVPATTLGVSSSAFIPYAVLLYILPIIYFLQVSINNYLKLPNTKKQRA